MIVRRALLCLAGLVVVTGCAGGGGGGSGEQKTITVFAAASLTDAFTELGEALETTDPDIEVRFSFAGSSALREQVLEGAPADVVATADEATMQPLLEAGRISDSSVFATNTLVLVTPPDDPGDVASLEDLERGELLVGLCAEPVPCGALARRVLTAAAVEAAIDTEEPDVRALLAKVAAGELDAALVYATDARAADDDVRTIELPASARVTTRLTVGAVDDAGDAAQRFVDFVVSPAGQRILAEHGFGAP